MNKKYYLCETKEERILAEFLSKDDCEHVIAALEKLEGEEGVTVDDMGTYTVISATSHVQALDMLSVVAHARNCNYASFVMEAKRLDEDERVQFADKWFALMRFMNASRFWQAD